MKIYRLKIVDCAMGSYWYANLIGMEVFATKVGDVGWEYKLVNVEPFVKSGKCFLLPTDVKVLEEFNGDIVERTVVEVVRRPEKKTVKMLAWFNGEMLIFLKDGVDPGESARRVPNEDRVIEVEYD